VLCAKTSRGDQNENDWMGEKYGKCCIEENFMQDFDRKIRDETVLWFDNIKTNLTDSEGYLV
jgi:hypothetical protein